MEQDDPRRSHMEAGRAKYIQSEVKVSKRCQMDPDGAKWG